MHVIFISLIGRLLHPHEKKKFAEQFPKEKILMELLCQSSSATLEDTCKCSAIPTLQCWRQTPETSVVALWLWRCGTDTFTVGKCRLRALWDTGLTGLQHYWGFGEELQLVSAEDAEYRDQNSLVTPMEQLYPCKSVHCFQFNEFNEWYLYNTSKI